MSKTLISKKKIKYLRVKDNSLWVKYVGEEEQFLTKGKVNLDDWFKTQGEYYKKARAETLERAKGWQERHQRYLKVK